jgi:hypothetical protein
MWWKTKGGQVMSKATNQQLIVLAAMSGCLAVMQTPGKVSQVDRRRFIKETEDFVNEAIAYWETTGDDVLNFVNNIQPAVVKWHEFLESQVRIRLSPVNLACMCARVIQDQLDRSSNRRKKYSLGEIAKRIETIHNYFDPEGNNFVAYDESGVLMDFLYHQIGWDFNWEKK